MTEISSRSARWLPAIVVAALLLFIAYLLQYVLLPFVIAGALAFVSAPGVRWMQKRLGFPRWLASLIPFFALLIAVLGMGFAAKVYLLPQISSILGNEAALIERVLGILFRGHPIHIGGREYGPHESAQILVSSLGANFDPRQAMADIGIAVAVVMGIVLTVVLFLYCLLDGPRIARGFIFVVPPAIRPRAAVVARRAGPVVFSYVRGIIVVMLYATVFTFVVVRFVLHVDNALILAVVVGVLELAPLIGPVLSTALIGCVAIEQMTFWGIIGVALFATGLRVTIDQFVGPLVLGRAVRLPAPLIIFSFLAGSAIWGVLGALVAIPVAAIIKIILEEAYREVTPDDTSSKNAPALSPAPAES